MGALRWTVSLGVLATACSSFHTASTSPDATGSGRGPDAAMTLRDAGHQDAGPSGSDATIRVDAQPRADAGARDASRGDAAPLPGSDAAADAPSDATPDAAPDATVTVDTVCGFAWSGGANICRGRTVASIGNIQFSDDPRIGFARSAGGLLGVCYANVQEDFLTRSLQALTFSPPTNGTLRTPVGVTLFQSTYTDTTPACGIGGGDGMTLHVLVNDTTNNLVEYGELVGDGAPPYTTFGPNPITGYLTLGVVGLDATHVLAAIGNATTGNIESYVVTPLDGGARFAPPKTVESGIGIQLLGAGQFSLQSGSPGAQPGMLIDMGPADASGGRADLAVYNGTTWAVQTLEGAALDAEIGYSPSLTATDGGWQAVYYEQNPGTSDAGTSQIHVASVAGSQVTVTRPLDASSDPDPSSPLVGAAAAVGPDGRLFIAYVASPTPGKVALYLARPESVVPGAPFIVDTVDDRLSAADPPSVNLIVDPSGRVDIVYMRLLANSVYYATKDP